MPDYQLNDTERRVLSYVSRGVSKDQAVEKIQAFFGMSENEVLGALASLKKQGLVVESKGVTSALVILTTSPIKVKSSMLDPLVVEQLTNKERGVRAGALKKQFFDTRTGEIREEKMERGAEKKRRDPDLGFEIY